MKSLTNEDISVFKKNGYLKIRYSSI